MLVGNTIREGTHDRRLVWYGSLKREAAFNGRVDVDFLRIIYLPLIDVQYSGAVSAVRLADWYARRVASLNSRPLLSFMQTNGSARWKRCRFGTLLEGE